MIHVSPLTRVPKPPRHLVREEKAAWRALAPKLVAVRVLTALDLSALELFCCSWCDYNRCSEMARAMSGRKRRAWSRLAASVRRTTRELAAQFFLLPDRWARLGLVDPKTGGDAELARIFRPGVPVRVYRPRGRG
jgi:P27 family predicted phage terminase small subunit